MKTTGLDSVVEAEIARDVRDGLRTLGCVTETYGADVSAAIVRRIERWAEIQARSDAEEDRLVQQGFFGRTER